MSLNGLDAAPVLEAHEAVGAEPGGWFLLKYASRDEVELLSRGNGGIVEVRKAIAEYEETSPLYGFLKYRRRSVIIKYLPEGCSRLIQARVAVHYNAVCERFSPYDTTFEIAEAADLKDSKLSAACSLHAASGSNASSSSSLRRRRLMEITEEEEEEPRSAKRKSVVLGDGDEEEEEPASPVAPAEPVMLNAELATSPEHTKFSADTTSEVPKFVGVETPSSPTESTRTSFQSTRPDLYSYSSYPHSKPRVKLGPRPSADVNVRPQTAGNFQPVSSIPAGVKLFGKGHRKAKSRDVSEAPLPASAAAPVDLSAVSLQAAGNSEVLPARPGTSSGLSTTSSIMPASTPSTAETTPPKPTMSREKARLMKAMQLREKKKQKMMEDAQQPSNTTEVVTPAPKVEDESQKDTAEGNQQVVSDHTADAEVEPKATTEDKSEPVAETAETEVKEDSLPVPPKRLSMIKADSGVVLENLSSLNDQASVQTTTDSRSQSPMLASSEPDQSTQASSLLGSLDEATQAKEEPLDEEPQDDEQAVNVPAENAHTQAKGEPVEDKLAPVQETTLQSSQDDAVKESVFEDIKVQPHAESSQTQQSTAVQVLDEVRDEPETGEIIIQLSDEDRQHIQEALTVSKQPLQVTTTDVIATSESDISDEDQVPAAGDSPTQPRKTVLPISKFSAKSQRSPQATKPTVEIPQSPPKNASATTTPTNDVSPQHTSPRSKPSTQDLRAAAKAAAQTSLPPPLPQSLPDTPAAETVDADKEEPVAEDTIPVISEDVVADKPEVGDQEEVKGSDTVPDDASAVEEGKEQPAKPLALSILTDRPVPSREVSRNGTETHLSEDEELMDELQSATVQEATPMIVAKTPVSPVFPTSVKGAPPSPGHVVRTVSNPLRASMIMPSDVSQSSARSVSSGAAYLHKVTQQQTNGNLVRKGTVGSSISQRIKALEMLSVPSGDSPAPTPTRVGRERPQSSFFSVRKSREPSRSPSVVDRASPFRQASTPSVSRDQSPDVNKPGSRDRSRSVASRLSMFESPPRSNAPSHSPSLAPRGRPESVSVTAKIVRDPNHNPHKTLEPPKDPSEFAPLDLKQSPLVVDHQKAQPEEPESSPDIAVIDSSTERRMSRESHRSEFIEPKETKRRSSLTIVRDFIKERRKSVTSSNPEGVAALQSSNTSRPPSSHQKNSHTVGSRLSISSRRSLSKDRDGISPTGLTESSISGDESRSSSSDKKKSRTGRFMRRLSELSSSRGKTPTASGISPPVAEEEIPEPVDVPRPSTMNTPAIVSDMGDVNVQFPDNLLWKRRHMRLDAQGFLTLSAPPGAAGGRALTQGTKRYHLSEFRQPYIPDVEVQELPNSVVLDFIEGSGVQVACEDRAGQVHVLQILREAHTAHAAAFGR